MKRQIQESNSDDKNDTTVKETEETKLSGKNNRSLAAMESVFNRAGEKVTIEDILKDKNNSETKIDEKVVEITEETPKINKRSLPIEDFSEINHPNPDNSKELLKNYLKQLEKKYEQILSVDELKEEYLSKIRKYLKKYGTRLQEMLQKRRSKDVKNNFKSSNFNNRRKRDLLLLSELENNPNNSDVSTSPSLSDKQLNPIFINPLLSNSSAGHHELIQKNDENKGDVSSGHHDQSVRKSDENKGDASSGDHGQSDRKSNENKGDASSVDHGQSDRKSNENKDDASSGHHGQSVRKSDENKGDALEDRRSTIEENNKSGPILKKTIKEDGTTLTTPFNKGENVNTGLFVEHSTQFDSATELTTNNDN